MKELIYQLLPRLWGPANTASDGCSDASSGRFSHVDEATLRYLGSLGITHLWVTGVLRHATRSRIGGFPPSSSQFVKGEAGSPYAITDYYDVNPYLADDPARRMEEFDAMVARIHAAGMKVILRIAAQKEGFDYDAFFRAYAGLWLDKDTLQMVYRRINDVHPMGYLRVNCTLQQFDEFLDFYGITEGDGMYLAPADRVIIW